MVGDKRGQCSSINFKTILKSANLNINSTSPTAAKYNVRMSVVKANRGKSHDPNVSWLNNGKND